MATKYDRELEQYRQLMLPPEEYREGFNWKTVAGAFFLGIVMLPGSMYLQLFAGQGIGPAAQWVTIILFAEIARRSFSELRMQEIYVLFLMSSLVMSAPFSGLLWNQFYVQSDYAHAMGIANDIPSWWAPSAAAIKKAGPTFFSRIWLAPILLVSYQIINSQIDQFGLGYVLYRLTNDVEKLPFPMAPVGASGITALVEEKDNKRKWRWRCFSIGAVLGIIFGAIYVGVPAITGAMLARPLTLIPIPWLDLTPSVANILPATPLNITFDITILLLGMAMPFWAVIGSVLGLALMMVFNPILFRHGILSNWSPQMGLVDTIFTNNVDFYLSFSVGLTFAVVLISIGHMLRPLLKGLLPGSRARGIADVAAAKGPSAWRRLITDHKKRGDFSIFIALGIYVLNSAIWISLSAWLVPGFPWKFFVFYAAVLMPLISYVTAKLEGTVGRSLQLPYVREATYILSGYRGVKIWFAPVPLPDIGRATDSFRVMELTGTRLPSVIKAKLVAIPVVLIASLIFSNLLWNMAPIPSDAFPFAQKMWDLQAKNLSLTYSSTLEGGSLFMEAWRWSYVGMGVGAGTLTYAILAFFGLPLMLFFGIVNGLGQGTPGNMIFLLIGALLGRLYFRRRFGSMWMKYTPVLLAGCACGMGLIAMVAVGFTILSNMISPLLY